MVKPKVKVAVTGAAGKISYTLLFRLVSGDVFGSDCLVDLQLLELPVALKATEGVAKELHDCGFPNLGEINIYDDATKAFSGVNWALLVGSKPRIKGMERSDLLHANGEIFVKQGKSLLHAASDLRVVVVGNPCNTNALIACCNCSDIPSPRFSAMTMLDENRAKWQLASKTGVSISQIENLCIWGNHSPTMYPDFENATIAGKAATERCSRQWLEDEFLGKVKQRGAEIISYLGSSSASSAAHACADHVINISGKGNKRFSAAIVTEREYYGVPTGLVFSFPLVVDAKGNWQVVEGLPLSAYSKKQIQITTDDLLEEREMVKGCL